MLDERSVEDGVDFDEFDASQLLSEEERGALFRKHFDGIAAIDDQIAMLNEEKKAKKRIAKNDGFPSDDINWALKARTTEDSETVIAALKRRLQIAGWLNFMPAGYQPDLFKDDRSTMERAYAKGAIASTFNRSPDPAKDGYAPESEEGQNWLRGFNEEQAETKKHLKSAEAKLRVLHAEGLKETAKDEAAATDPTDAALPQMAGRKVPKGGRKKKPE